jgi:hypothetical protein
MRGTGRYVYDFDEPSEGGRELLGGKGIGLAEMTQLGVPVPAGFTITTDACRAYLAAGDDQLPDGLPAEIDRHIDALEGRAGKRFGDPQDPLLVSVRSGAAISMPGMMDTILNLGLNDEAVDGLAASTGNARFAYDSYRRLIQMYGEVVMGIDAHRFEQALSDLKAERGVQQDVELDADDLRELVGTFKRLYEDETGSPFPEEAREQLTRAVARRVRVLEHAAGAGLPARAPHPGRPRHCGERRADGLRQQRRGLRHRGGVHARPLDRASRGSTGSSSPTRRARTSSPGSGHRSRSPRWSSGFPMRSSS